MKETEDKNKWKKFQAHGLQELMLLKWSYYPMQSTDSMKSLSKLQWHLSQKQNQFFLICMESQNTQNR